MTNIAYIFVQDILTPISDYILQNSVNKPLNTSFPHAVSLVKYYLFKPENNLLYAV